MNNSQPSAGKQDSAPGTPGRSRGATPRQPPSARSKMAEEEPELVSVLMEGMLKKKGGLLGGYKRFLVRLTPDELLWYAMSGSKQLKGRLPLPRTNTYLLSDDAEAVCVVVCSLS